MLLIKEFLRTISLKSRKLNLLLFCFILLILVSFSSYRLQAKTNENEIELVSYSLSKTQPNYYNAFYFSDNQNQIRSRNFISIDNGKTWSYAPIKNDNLEKLDSFSKRAPVTSVYHKKSKSIITFFNCLDNPNIPLDAHEPPQAQKEYYLRYRVSNSDYNSWLYDKPLVQNEAGFSKSEPFADIKIGRNAFYLGDVGSKPIISAKNEILLPVQTTLIYDSLSKKNSNGLFNPGGGHTYTDVIILKGKWNKSRGFSWSMLTRLKGNPELTTRGLIEPTLVKLINKKLLVVMRGSNGGSNDPNHKLKGVKWYSYSSNNGKTWSEVKPWNYDDESEFFSPSSMSLLFMHSNKKCYWIGNICQENPKGNSPRTTLVIGEVNQNKLKLVKSSIKILDCQNEEDKSKGDLDLGHMTILEDQNTKEVIVVYQRIYSKQKERDWVTIKLRV